jgi:hypothetical protein
MVYDALLSRVPVHPANIHAIPAERITPEEAAIAYEATLKDFHGSDTLDPELSRLMLKLRSGVADLEPIGSGC